MSVSPENTHGYGGEEAGAQPPDYSENSAYLQAAVARSIEVLGGESVQGVFSGFRLQLARKERDALVAEQVAELRAQVAAQPQAGREWSPTASIIELFTRAEVRSGMRLHLLLPLVEQMIEQLHSEIAQLARLREAASGVATDAHVEDLWNSFTRTQELTWSEAFRRAILSPEAAGFENELYRLVSDFLRAQLNNLGHSPEGDEAAQKAALEEELSAITALYMALR